MIYDDVDECIGNGCDGSCKTTDQGWISHWICAAGRWFLTFNKKLVFPVGSNTDKTGCKTQHKRKITLLIWFATALIMFPIRVRSSFFNEKEKEADDSQGWFFSLLHIFVFMISVYFNRWGRAICLPQMWKISLQRCVCAMLNPARFILNGIEC